MRVSPILQKIRSDCYLQRSDTLTLSVLDLLRKSRYLYNSFLYVMCLQKWLLFVWALSLTDFVGGVLPEDQTNLEDSHGNIFFCNITFFGTHGISYGIIPNTTFTNINKCKVK